MLRLLIAFLPSRLKIALLRSMGAKIGRGCYIGFSVLTAETLELGDCVYVGHFNLLWRLNELRLESGSRLTMGNWITGAGIGRFVLGRNGAITRFHFLEASGDILIGANTILAGRNTHLFTHGIAPDNLDDVRPIVVGAWCYVGSSSRFAPGAEIADGTFVGMGAVVTGRREQQFVLVGGVPARVIRELNPTAVYFNRPYLPHSHHPAWYRG